MVDTQGCYYISVRDKYHALLTKCFLAGYCLKKKWVQSFKVWSKWKSWRETLSEGKDIEVERFEHYKAI